MSRSNQLNSKAVKTYCSPVQLDKWNIITTNEPIRAVDAYEIVRQEIAQGDRQSAVNPGNLNSAYTRHEIGENEELIGVYGLKKMRTPTISR